MAATPDRVLDKFQKLHTKLGGYDRPVSFVKFTAATTDYFAQPNTLTEETALTIPAIVKDQPGEDIAQNFPGGIFQDQRIFSFLADSFQTRLPLATLSLRCENFLLERTGQDKGGIKYGNTIYTIERWVARPILGTVAARYHVLATAQKQKDS